jgi:antitoxin PrlF
MPQSSITAKGQTTVPLEVREALKIPPGSRIEWSIQGDGSAIVRPQPNALDLFGSLKPAKGVPTREKEKSAVAELIAAQAAKEGLE